jgi:hypothetical protein
VNKRRRGHKSKPKLPRSKRINGRKEPSAIPSKELVEVEVRQGRGGDSGKLLTDPTHVKADARMIQQAVRGRWGIRRRNMIQKRLLGIVEKTEVEVMTKEGPAKMEGPADANAISAARVLVAMNGQDQADDHLEITKGKPGVNVNVLSTSDPSQPGSSRILQLAKSLGATELIIDGSAVPVTEGTREPEESRGLQQAPGKPVGKDSALAQAKALLGLDG